RTLCSFSHRSSSSFVPRNRARFTVVSFHCISGLEELAMTKVCVRCGVDHFWRAEAQESDAKLKGKKRRQNKAAEALEDVLERLRPGCKMRLEVRDIQEDRMLVGPAGEDGQKFNGVVHITGAVDRVSLD